MQSISATDKSPCVAQVDSQGIIAIIDQREGKVRVYLLDFIIYHSWPENHHTISHATRLHY